MRREMEVLTEFETLSMELIGKVETDNRGMYIKHTNALYNISVDVLFDDGIDKEQWKSEIKRCFYQRYPYLRTRSGKK